jgi:glycosyltransferase involved in cell wall biosynthesis
MQHYSGVPAPLEKKTLVTFWTRNLDFEPPIGRLHTAKSIRGALREHHRTNEIILDILKRGRSLQAVTRSFLSLAWGLVSLKPLPLQCALFGAFDPSKIFLNMPAKFDLVYFDGVRTLLLLRAIRAQSPDAHIVCDLDDLMSRRMQFWLDVGAGISLGYIEKLLSPGLARLLSRGPLARAVIAYERRSLRRAEQEIVRLCDAVVLVSSADAKDLREQSPSSLRSKINVIPPPVNVKRAPAPLGLPIRFVFVGTDKLLQNRLTIQRLSELWQEAEPSVALHIYGLQQAKPDVIPPNVIFHGFVDNIDEVYDGNSVLLTPSVIGGGMKTKVLEAFSYGAPVVGNAFTFEGMNLKSYPMILEGSDSLLALLREPEKYLEKLNRAAEIGHAYVSSELSLGKFNEAWQRLFSPEKPVDASSPSDVSLATIHHVSSSFASRGVRTA